MNLEWSVFALADRDGIFDFIEADSPRSAIMVDSAIEAQTERLVDFPDSGDPDVFQVRRNLSLQACPILSPIV